MTPNILSLSKDDQKQMIFAMRLSLLVGFFMLFLKTYAYSITGSAAILSDAAESVIHIFAVGFATYSMWLSLKPPDENHLYGHDKISFFSAGFEGAMIIIAAAFIIYESFYKLLYGFEVDHINEGALFIVLATVINIFLSLYLIGKGKKYQSIILEANGKHILTDCWTSIGVIIALILVKLTGLSYLDPCIAIVLAINILFTGGQLVKRAVHGLMDQVDPDLHKIIVDCVQKETLEKGLTFHNLKHRVSGYKIFIEFHLLFPKDISLAQAHEIASAVESNIKNFLSMPTEIFTHLEPQKNHDRIHKKFGLSI